MINNDNSKKGFSGLVNLVSDISIVENVNDYAFKDFAPKESSSKYEDINSDSRSKKQKESNSLIWGWGIILIIFCLLWIISSVQTEKNSSSVSAPSPSLSQRSNPAPLNTVNTTPNSNSNTQLQYEKPPVGTNNTFNISQLRWYFREKIRLEVISGLVNTNDTINASNKLSDDFHSRCWSFSYLESDYRRAESEVETRRSEIIEEAILDAILLGYVPERLKQTPQIGYISGNKK
ncbi:MAG: hypothetical protein FWH52_02970 [Synergistaceae bacterium]|nr:hypothetical protein [Synergistaceae bacterium]